MFGRGRRAALVLVFGLMTSSLQAGWWWEKKKEDKACCPAPSYPKIHYWAPAADRVGAHFHGSHLSPYAPACDAPAVILYYKCPPVDPGVLVGERVLLP